MDLRQCKVKFKVMGALFETKYLEKEIRTLKRKRFFEKYGIIVFASIFFGILVYVNYLLGHFNDLWIGKNLNCIKKQRKVLTEKDHL